MAFTTKAGRSGLPVKGFIDGPSGSGKTYSALEIATGLVEGTGKGIAVLDSQNGQSLRYAGSGPGLFEFFSEIIRQYDPDTYVRMIREAEAAKLGVLVIDSATHEWSHCLEMVDQIAKRTGSANNAWRDVTPAHKRFVEAIIQATIPVIVTARTRTDWLYVEQQSGNRKITVPRKMGTKPEQRDQFEFEFDFWLRMDRDHRAGVEKSVFPFMETDTDIGRPTREIGRQIREWFEGTTFDADAVLADRARHEQASSTGVHGSLPVPARAAPPSKAPSPSPAPASAPDIIDPDALPPGVTGPKDGGHPEPDPADAEAEDAEEETDEDDDSDMWAELYARYRTLAAVAVMRKHPHGYAFAGLVLDDMTEAEILAEIDKLEREYPDVKDATPYQCDVCGQKIYPYAISEHEGHEFPGLQLIAVAVRDFGRVLCAKDLATERQKKRRRGPAPSGRPSR